MKLRPKLRREIGEREILTPLFRRSIKSLNLIDFSFIKQVDGQIWLLAPLLTGVEGLAAWPLRLHRQVKDDVGSHQIYQFSDSSGLAEQSHLPTREDRRTTPLLSEKVNLGPSEMNLRPFGQGKVPAG